MKFFKGYKIFFLILVLVLLSACGNSGGTDSKGVGKKTLTYWANWNEGEPQQRVIQNIITDYENENPDIKVEVEWMGRQSMSKVRNALLTGDGPDLIDKAPSEIIGAIGSDTESLNFLLDTKIHNEEDAIGDVFLDNILELYEDDGKTFFIPYQVLSSGFFFDKNMFAENEVTPPKTWDEFIDVAKGFKEKGIAPLAQDGSIGFYNAYYYYWLSSRINGSGAFNLAASDPTGEEWDKPGFLDAAKKVEQLVKEDLFLDGYQGSQFPAAQTQWVQGQAAMILNGSWITHETSGYASEDFEYDVFPFPEVKSGDGDYNDAEVELIGWAAPKGANLELVEDFIAFAMQKKYHQQIVDDVNNISSRKDLDAPKNLKSLKEYVQNSTQIHQIYDGVQGEYPKWWNTTFLPIHDKLLFGDISAEEFIEQIKADSIKFWAEE